MKKLLILIGLVAATGVTAQTIPVDLSAPTDVQKEGFTLKAYEANQSQTNIVYTWNTWALEFHVADVNSYHQRKMAEYVRQADQFQATKAEKAANLASLREIVPHLTADQISLMNSNALWFYANP